MDDLAIGETVELRYLAHLWANTRISTSQFRVLLYLAAYGQTKLSVLGREVRIEATNLSHLVRRMEGYGLVQLTPHPFDGRASCLSPTDEGMRLVRSLLRPVMIGGHLPGGE